MNDKLNIKPDQGGGLTCSVPRALLEDALEELCELRGERNWWKDEPRCGYSKSYASLCSTIDRMEIVLNAQKELKEQERWERR